MHHTTTPSPSPTQVPAIEDHPDYDTVMRMASLDAAMLRHRLAASRWVAGLLATIAANAKAL